MKFNKALSGLGFSVFAFIPVNSYAAVDQDIEKFMSEFNANPVAVMNKIPEKKTISGTGKIALKFSKEDIANGNYVTEKDEARKQLLLKAHSQGIHTESEYLSNDNARDLLDNPNTFVDNIMQLDGKNLAQASLPFQPWSSTYWPSYEGGIAYRYSDPNMPQSENFRVNYNYLVRTPAATLIQQNRIDQLSPAEKYDLLMNDSSFTLTNTVLNALNNKNNGSPIERWEGICHGWAPVANLYKRPVRTVTVSNSSGTKINFYPADIKALTSLLWADLPSNPKFVGGRCNVKKPQTDRNGRIIAQECFDSNPATVHLALLNQLGLSQKGFVFDATYDAEVWNQPVLSYSYVYFNPQTNYSGAKASDVAIPLQNYTKDKFKQYRSYRSAYVVGVKLVLNYIVETEATAARTDSPSRDAVQSVTYYYDLELDNSGNIIGGEWYQNAHPDFLWTPASDADVSVNALPSDYYYQNYIWNDSPRGPFSQWTYSAQYVSSQFGVPLDHIVKNLAAWSSVGNIQAEKCQQPCVPSQYNWHR